MHQYHRRHDHPIKAGTFPSMLLSPPPSRHHRCRRRRRRRRRHFHR
jgi:hypothetical protein